MISDQDLGIVMIYVINLDRSTDRKENIIKQFETLGVKPKFFSAVDGKTRDHAIFNKYNDGFRNKVKGKSLTRGQLGCFASHYLIWERCVQCKKAIIVLEDDALINKELFLSFLKASKFFSEKYECIRLFANHDKKHKAIRIEEKSGFSIAKFTKGHKRSTGYFITPGGAEKLLKHANTWFLTLDIYMDRFWDHGVECYGTIPACLTNDPKFETTIDYGKINKQKRSFSIKFRREVFSASEQLRRMVHNVKFRMNTFQLQIKKP